MKRRMSHFHGKCDVCHMQPRMKNDPHDMSNVCLPKVSIVSARAHKKRNQIYSSFLSKLDRNKASDMKSPSTSPTMTMTIVKALLTLLLFASATPTTTACRCALEPTLELELQDETTAIFRGMIVPSLQSSTTINKEFRVVIEKVYQNGAVPLRAYQTITIVTPRNSCGIPSLPLFSTFLFSGVVADKSGGIVPFNGDRNLMLQPEQELPTKETDTTDTESKQTFQLRRTQSTETTSTASVSMSVHLCAYYKPWRTVTRKEKCQLERSVICN